MPLPIKVESTNTYLAGGDEVKLPVVTNMNNLLRPDFQRLAHFQVEVGGLQPLIVGDRGKDFSEIGLNVSKKMVQKFPC